jgi:hypothetical protein
LLALVCEPAQERGVEGALGGEGHTLDSSPSRPWASDPTRSDAAFHRVPAGIIALVAAVRFLYHLFLPEHLDHGLNEFVEPIRVVVDLFG